MAETKELTEQGNKIAETKELTEQGNKIAETKELTEQGNKIEEKTKRLTGVKHSFDSLITRMIGAFLLLIIMIILVGVVSYTSAKRTIGNEVKASLSETVSAKGSYLELGLANVDDRMMEIMSMEDMNLYYLNPNLDTQNLTVEQTTAKGNIQAKIENIKAISEFVYHIYLISDMGTGISTTQARLSAGYYDRFIASKEGEKIAASDVTFGYTGAHPFLEDSVHEVEDTFECSDYAISMWRKASFKTNVILIVDIDRDVIYNALSEVNNGDGSFTVFIGPDGNETVYVGSDSGEEKTVQNMPVFSDLSVYQKANASEDTDGFFETKWQGKSCVFAYSKIGKTGAMLATIVPMSQFMGSVKSIQTITILMVLIAFAVAVLMCVFLSRSLSRGVSEITIPLDRASRGDFTVTMKSDRKDEFGAIAASAANMIDGIKHLIREMMDVMGAVKNTAELVGSSTGSLTESSEEISGAISEIEGGVSVQAKDAQECVIQINALSDQIRTVYGYTDEITRISAEAGSTIAGSVEVINDLTAKSKATADITGAVLKDIMSLSELSKSIGKFVDIINDIAEQTNLLSLNASIEAARAGEAGRGFSVVAEEIRNLADQSVQSADQIGGIVNQIQKQTKQTVDAVQRADEIVTSQSSSLGRTLEAFHHVSEHVRMMAEDLSKITKGMELMENTKMDAVSAITNISAVSEETSANASQVDENAKRQKQAVQELMQTVELLKEKSYQMEEAVSLFHVEE